MRAQWAGRILDQLDRTLAPKGRTPGRRPEYLVQEDREQLRGALCRLSPDHREVLELVYFKQLSELEAAERLGISHSATRKRVERAREELQEKFPSACR